MNIRGKEITIKIGFKKEDFWIGLFTNKKGAVRHIYICILPTIPIHIKIAPENITVA